MSGLLKRLVILAAIAPCAACPVAAQIPAYIDTLGQMAGNQVVAERVERECLAGKQLAPSDWNDAATDVENVLAAYFAAAASGNEKKLGSIFTSRSNNPTWKGPDGTEANAASDPFATTAMAVKPVRSDLVIAGDGLTARGIWLLDISAPSPGGPRNIQYAADFKKSGLWGWKLWHMEVGEPPEKPTPLRKYCHFRLKPANFVRSSGPPPIYPAPNPNLASSQPEGAGESAFGRHAKEVDAP